MPASRRKSEQKVVQKPKVFIGSSREAEDYAAAVQALLESVSEPIVWADNVFAPAHGTLEDLLHVGDYFDFGVILLTPDDTRRSRGRQTPIPRDNAMFVLGLLLGALGRDRVFFLRCAFTA